MTLQQMRYVLAIAKVGSINLAARQLFVTQPSMTTAIRKLEKEIGRKLFIRNARGMQLTEAGEKFLGHAERILREMEMLEKWHARVDGRRYFSVSTQHYTFAANAFAELVRRYKDDGCEFSFLEIRTRNIIENVGNLKSEIGILGLHRFNEPKIRKELEERSLYFSPMFTVKPHVFLSRNHPLAKKKRLNLSDLKPYHCLTFDQGEENTFYFSEEIGGDRHILLTDRMMAADLLTEMNAYILTTGLLPVCLQGQEILVRPLNVDETITVGVIRHANKLTSDIGQTFLELLAQAAQQTERHREEGKHPAEFSGVSLCIRHGPPWAKR